MSRDDRDKRGGHARRKSDFLSCQCCPNLSRPDQARNRTRRSRLIDAFERRADGR